MIKSDNLDQLAAALSQFQGEVENVEKSKKAMHHSYADLPGILEEIRPILSKYKLSVVQLPSAAHERVALTTLLMHESGQYIGSTVEMEVEISLNREGKKTMSLAQSVGAVITYARRYALAAIVGVGQEDTDAVVENGVPVKSLKRSHTNPPKSNTPEFTPITSEQAQVMVDLIDGDRTTLENILAWGKTMDINNFPSDKYERAVQRLKELKVA